MAPLALSLALGIIFPLGFDFHPPLGDLHRWHWAGGQQQPASLFSLHFTVPSCRPGPWVPPPCPRAQVGSRGTAPSLPSLPAPAKLAGFGAGESRARSRSLHPVRGALFGMPAVLRGYPCVVLPVRLCCAASLGAAACRSCPRAVLVTPYQPLARWLQQRCPQAAPGSLQFLEGLCISPRSRAALLPPQHRHCGNSGPEMSLPTSQCTVLAPALP